MVCEAVLVFLFSVSSSSIHCLALVFVWLLLKDKVLMVGGGGGSWGPFDRRPEPPACMCPTLTLDTQVSSYCVTSRTFHELDPQVMAGTRDKMILPS